MTHYDKGRRAEWIVRDYFKSLGYTVTRAAGSKGPADLIAHKPSLIWLVQVKSGRKPCGKEFRLEQRALQKMLYEWPSKDVKASVFWQRRGRDFVEWYLPFGTGAIWIEQDVALGEGS